MKRHKLNKSERKEIWKKYNGRCAYCGHKIAFSEMAVDHIKSLSHGGLDILENMNPSCRLCNNYKNSADLNTFKKFFLGGIVKRLRKIYIFRVAENYGMITVNCWDHKFYYEKNKGVKR